MLLTLSNKTSGEYLGCFPFRFWLWNNQKVSHPNPCLPFLQSFLFLHVTWTALMVILLLSFTVTQHPEEKKIKVHVSIVKTLFWIIILCSHRSHYNFQFEFCKYAHIIHCQTCSSLTEHPWGKVVGGNGGRKAGSYFEWCPFTLQD